MDKTAIAVITASVDGWLSEAEGQLLYDLARSCTGRGVIVEIGSWNGKSTIWLAAGAKSGNRVTVFAVDPHTGSPEHRSSGGPVWTFDNFKRNIRTAGVEEVVVPVVAASTETARAFDRPVELVFIDGAHEYESVKADFLAWYPKLIEGGIMAFHDTTGWPGPKKIVEEYVYRSRAFKRVGLVDSITFAEKTHRSRWTDRMHSEWVLWLKRAYEIGRTLSLPKPLRRAGKLILKAVQ